jgi:hypothetical protein
MEEDHYRQLQADLEAARGDEAYTYLAILIFLTAIGIEVRLLKPLLKLCIDLANDKVRGPHGGNARPIHKTLHLATAAAVVTSLYREGVSLSAVLQEVATDAELDPAEIKKFRNELSRGRASAYARQLYENILEELKEETLTTKR